MTRAQRTAPIVICAVLLAAAFIALRTCGAEAPTDVREEKRPATTSAAKERPPRTREAAPESPPMTETPAPRPAPAAPTANSTPSPDGRTSVVVEVADESGAAVAGADVRLRLADGASSSAAGAKAAAALMKEPHATDAAGAVKLDVANDADGARLKAYGTADGFPPLAPVEFAVQGGCVVKVRLVAAKPQMAGVVVVDAKTDRPLAGARVVSSTETARRREVQVAAAPPAMTDAEGRCALVGLSAGEHEIEIDADGHRQAKAKWSGAELRVRLQPHAGSAKIVVKVIGPGGVPVEGAEVTLVGTDRDVKSDADGKVVFADTDPGFAMVSLDVFAPDDAPAAVQALDAAPRRTAETDTEDGGTYELVLGFPPTGTAALETRLVRDDGSPVVGVELTVSIGDDETTVTTDASGVARFGRMPKGEFSAYASLDGTMWFFDGADLAAGGGVSVTWTLGTAKVKGRLVTGADKRGVADVGVWFRGKHTGVADTDESGAFELTGVLPGTYMVDAKSDDAFAAPREVRVPVEGDVVVELVRLGRVAVRFAADDRAALRKAHFSLCVEGMGVAGIFRPGSGDDDLVSTQVLPGRYEVDVSFRKRERRFLVEVKSGETAVVEVKAP